MKNKIRIKEVSRILIVGVLLVVLVGSLGGVGGEGIEGNETINESLQVELDNLIFNLSEEGYEWLRCLELNLIKEVLK